MSGVTEVLVGTSTTAFTSSSTALVRGYMRLSCPRCDRPARDNYEWGKWVREALAEAEAERIRRDIATWPGPGRR